MKSLVLFLLITLSSCISNNKLAQKGHIRQWGYKSWRQDFKDKALCDCILEGMQNKLITDQVNRTDKSFSSPINYVLFDSLSKEVIKPIIAKIKADSLKSTNTVSEAIAGKKVFKECLIFYRSKKLDSIAMSENNKWRKIKNIDSLILKKIPTY